MIISDPRDKSLLNCHIVTIDEDEKATLSDNDNTLENDVVTLRNRDTMEQISLTVDEAIKYVQERIKF